MASCQLQAQPISTHLSPADQRKLTALQTQFEQEMKKQLAQKEIDDYSFDEISDIALNASKNVYGAHPKLMKQKVLFELQQLPLLEEKTLSNYQVKESLNLIQLQTELSPWLKPEGQGGERYEDWLPLFYSKTPEQIALMMKHMLYARNISPKQLGQRAIITQFMPDQTFQIKASTPPQIALKTFDDNLFLVQVQITESGILKPQKVEWLQSKAINSKSL